MNTDLSTAAIDYCHAAKPIGSHDASHVIIRWLGLQDYLHIWQAMQTFTQQRNPQTVDEIWLLEHSPVLTQGQNGKPEHILNPGNIPVIQTDRGGQVTYHGPGQLMIYVLIDLKRKKLNVRELVTALEQSIVDILSQFNIQSYAKREAPGIYVAQATGMEKKISSIGLRIRKGCTYHGIAFNVALDLSPFERINPCGFKTLQMTSFELEGGLNNTYQTGRQLVNYLMNNLGYTTGHYTFNENADEVDGSQSK